MGLGAVFGRGKRIVVHVMVRGRIGDGWYDVDRALKVPEGTTLAELIAIGDRRGVPLSEAIANSPHLAHTLMVNGERFYPEHVMTREEALRTYTVNNAYAAFEEGFKGTLAPGMYADMVVLSQDILTVEETDIPDTRVEMTFVGGELKYSRDMDVALLDD